MWYRTEEVLRAAVEEAFTHVTPDYLRKTPARTWHRIQLCYDDEGLRMFRTLKPLGTCPYQALIHNRYCVNNKGGGVRPLLGHSLYIFIRFQQ
jgi:hypothetical protein